MYRIEVSISPGSGKLKAAGGLDGVIKESMHRAFGYLPAHGGELGVGRELDTSDLHVEVINLLGNKIEAEIGVAFFVACFSALKRSPVSAGTLVLGDMSIQGNIKPLPSLVEPLQVAMDNGAKKAVIGRRQLQAPANDNYISP